jgi:hypothetical protein
VYTTVVPYSYFRISELSGYGAGNRAPQFYQTCFDLVTSGRPDDIAMEHAIAVLRAMRRAGDPLSTADAISVTHHAGLLARLRGRPHPTLDDISDALVTCCCKGNPGEEGRKLRDAMDAAGIGNRIGRVTPKIGRLPIVNDFHTQLSDLELGEVLGKEKRMAVKLDTRDPLAARRSAFLHRVAYLKVPFASLAGTGGDFSGTLFREEWQLKWDPRTEPALIEQKPVRRHGRFGGSQSPARGAGRGRHERRGDVRPAARSGRYGHARPRVRRRRTRAAGIDSDPSFVSQATALRTSGGLEQYAAFRALRRDVVGSCWAAASTARASRCHAANVPGRRAAGVVNGTDRLAEVVLARLGPVRPRPVRAGGAERGRGVAGCRSCAARSSASCARSECAAAVLAPRSPTWPASVDVMVTAGDLLDGCWRCRARR